VRFDDPELVAREYADEARLLARRAVFVDLVEGPNAEDLAFQAVAEASPGRVQDGLGILRPHFEHVERRDVDATVVFPDRAAVCRYVASTIRGAHLADSIPELKGAFRARSSQSVFVAEKPA
jgi:hypothetical protein